MNTTLEQVRALVSRGEVRVSLHGYEELAADNIRVRDALASLDHAIVVEDYPSYARGPAKVGLG